MIRVIYRWTVNAGDEEQFIRDLQAGTRGGRLKIDLLRRVVLSGGGLRAGCGGSSEMRRSNTSYF